MTNSSQSLKSLEHLQIWARHVSLLTPPRNRNRCKCRRIPFALEGKPESEIDNLVSSEIFRRKLGAALEGPHITFNVADDIVLVGVVDDHYLAAVFVGDCLVVLGRYLATKAVGRYLTVLVMIDDCHYLVEVMVGR
ncbi:hypothetical protein ElyMa_002708900 [Elysia marginata]|uniref:Uncharacterized protein n=1 Tax=Elysia marginata TaxID=1093978 RepID=A0AAV4HFW8_9GAST|nr:hypothetical protein ElyMa_002708900 [Elysia marginata]